MKFPISWLNDYLDMSGISAKEYAHEMTMSGSKVEGIENIGDEIQNVVVGKLLEVTDHPDSDHLKICQVDLGNEVTQIVTGAQNVKAGDYVPVAKHGSSLPGGVKIKKGKLRGVVSNGMLCSYGELSLSKEDVPYAIEDGILILDKPYPLGKDIKEVFSLNDDVVEFEITSNRPDCFSVIGLARETAATFDRKIAIKKPSVKESGPDINGLASVEVKSDDCLRYSARVIKNVKIGPSPKWMRDRLERSGIRSINNIVDITNYILLEYGQPMHAFDLSYLEGKKVVVRKAQNGEKIVTLDGEERQLDDSMLVICDSKKPVCVAGVMGGENSEVKETTKDILFECATFDGTSVRLTAKKLGLRTESSSRYEKGLDINNVIPSLDRACELVNELNIGEVACGMIDICNRDFVSHKIKFRPDKINAFLGTSISKEEMVDILKKLYFEINGDEITVPSFRPDVEAEADVAEEIARIYGYNKILSTPLRGETTSGMKNLNQRLEDICHNALISQGLYEIVSYSFTSPKVIDSLKLCDDKLKKEVVISNPLGEDTSVMRTTLLSSVMNALSLNQSQRNTDVALYEFANVYIPVDGQKLPDEHKNIAIGMYGDYDFFNLKGIIENLMDKLNITNVEYRAETENTTFHPGRCASVFCGDKKIGTFGEIHPEVAASFSLSQRIYAAELDFNTICSLYNDERKFKKLPKFPAVSRDIALLVDDEVTVGEIEKIIYSCSGKIFEGCKLFDVYKGEQIPDGKKSVAYSISYRASDRTLTDDEINSVFEKTLKKLEKDLKAELR